jgi:hypothetical protein
MKLRGFLRQNVKSIVSNETSIKFTYPPAYVEDVSVKRFVILYEIWRRKWDLKPVSMRQILKY